jgi:hypothetical protein
MKKLIRNGVFETNSSSSHSISIADETKQFVLDTLYPDQNGVITLNGGEFGWEWFKHNDAETKANYAAQALGLNSSLVDVIKEQTGASEVIIDVEDGYIDHDSYGLVPTNKEELRNFIFNKNSWLFGGNDNSEPDPTFYHVPEYKDGTMIRPIYKFELKLENFDKKTKFLEYPTEEEIQSAFESLLSGVKLYDSNGTLHFDDDNSFYSRLYRDKKYFEYSRWQGSYIDFFNKICYFSKNVWEIAKDIYDSKPESKNEDWSSEGYRKAKQIQDDLLKDENSPYKKGVKFYVTEI